MTVQEKAEWLNKFDRRVCRNWGVIKVDGEEVLGHIGLNSAYTVPRKEIVFILLGEIGDLVERNEADKLCKEIFEILCELCLPLDSSSS